MDRKWCTQAVGVVLLSLGLAERGLAQHSPVMDMAPRWEGGWGFQVRHETRSSNKLLTGTSETSNRLRQRRSISTTWLEGVYTFKRELRVTVKIPWAEQSRNVVQDGVPVKHTGSGLGDAILGLQLKRYYNNRSSTGNFSLTPSIRLPTGSTSDDYPVGDGSWDVGATASFSAEMAKLYQYYDLFYWHNGKGKRDIDQGDELGFDVNVGIHPYHDNLRNLGVFLMVDVSGRYEARGTDTAGTTGGTRLSLGPVLVGYWNNIMARAEVKFPVYEKVWDTQVSHGTDFTIGIGFTF